MTAPTRFSVGFAVLVLVAAAGCGGPPVQTDLGSSTASLAVCSWEDGGRTTTIFAADSPELAVQLVSQWAFGGEAVNDGIGGAFLVVSAGHADQIDPGGRVETDAQIFYGVLNGQAFPNDEVTEQASTTGVVQLENPSDMAYCGPEAAGMEELQFTVETAFALDDGRVLSFAIDDLANDPELFPDG